MVLILTSCNDFFGKKTSLDFIEVPTYDKNNVAFVPIQPVLTNAVRPVTICAGYDQLIYIVDEVTQKIISLDVSGRELGRMTVPGVKFVTQDRRLNLLAIGTKDTLIGSTTYSLQAIYKINPYNNGTYSLNSAVITKIILHPFYFKSSFSSVDAAVSLNSIAVMANDDYYVTRSGNNNSSLQFGGPDDAVLLFDRNDQFQKFLVVNTDQGEFSDYFKKPFGITSLAKAPQSFNVNTSKDFVWTSFDNFAPLKVQYMTEGTNDNGQIFSLNTSLQNFDTSKAGSFLYTANRFTAPKSIEFSGDGTNYIFVSDSEKDSVYIFTNTGFEGVKAPAGSSSTKNINVSFGGTGTGPLQFNEPRGLAFYDKILYVCDAGNGRVLRFKLTTDF